MTIRSKGVKVTRFLRRSLLAFAGVLSLLFAGSVFKIMLATAIAATAYLIPGTGNIISFAQAPRTAPSVESAESQLYGLNSQPITNTRINMYPATAIDMDDSIALGVAELDEYFRSDEFKQDSADGPVVIKGDSQGALVIMAYLKAFGGSPDAPPADSVEFILAGNPSTPNGGVTDRVPGLTVPVVGGPLPGPVTDSGYKVTVVDKQYDFYADFVKNPLNLVALVNNIAGLEVHSSYAGIDVNDPRNVVTVVGNTTYIKLYNERLPILRPLYALKVFDPLLEHILDPALRVLIETGYDRQNPGVSSQLDLTYGSMDPLTTTMKMAEAVIRGVYTLANGLPPQSTVKVEKSTPEPSQDAAKRSSEDDTVTTQVVAQADEPTESIDSQLTDEASVTQEPEAVKAEAPHRNDAPAKTEEVKQEQVTNEQEVSEQSEKLSEKDKKDELKAKREQKREERKAAREEAEAAANKDTDKDDPSSKKESDASDSAQSDSGDAAAA